MNRNAEHIRNAEHYIHGTGGDRVVILPARVCAWLDRAADLDALAARVRGHDGELDNLLTAIRWAGRNWSSYASGTTPVTPTQPGALSPWLTTTAVAISLGISEPGVRKALRERRLEGENVEGRWRVSREALAQFRSSRSTGEKS